MVGQRVELRGMRSDGSEFPMELALTRLPDEDPPAFVGVIRDISERKLAEQKLSESHQLLRAVAEGTTDALFVKDRQGHYLAINSAGARFLDQPVEEIVGKDDRAFMSRETADQIMQLDRSIQETGEISVKEEEVTASGVTRMFHSIKAPYRDPEGNIIGVIGVARDITERKRAEVNQRFLGEASAVLVESLESESMLDRLANLTVRDLADGCVLSLNREGEAPEVVARHRGGENAQIAIDVRKWSRLVAELGPEAERGPLLRHEHGGSILCLTLKARETLLGNLLLAFTRRFAEQADVTLATELARRISTTVDNLRLYHRAQDMIRARDEFLSIASHELRTPLTPLHLLVGRMVRSVRSLESPAAEGLMRCLATAERQLDRLSQVVSNLLDVSYITSQGIQLELEPVDLRLLVREVLDRLTPLARREGSAIRFDAQTGVTGSWDRMRIDQLVTNLVSNAIKYGRGQPIEVTVELKSAARLVVRDHGIGIAPKDQERIFQRFERAVSERNYGGFGLGLWIAQQIAAAHQGTIGVESTLGSGSTFTVDLPRQRRDVRDLIARGAAPAH
jgi:PAS domain S-box-containing protein